VTHTWLALSVTASGPNRERDAVTAVAAARFAGGAELASFAAPVSIPLDHGPVSGPAGDEDAPPVGAPALPGVLTRLAELMTGATVVGLGAPAALELLWRHGLRPHPPVADTLDLAAVALPALPARDLPGLCAALAIPLAADAPPLAAARAERQLFEALTAQLAELPPDTLAAMGRLATRARWALAPVFRDLRPADRHRRARTPAPPPVRPEPLHPAPKAVRVDVANLEAALGPGGVLAQRWPGFEDRPAQRAMLHRVAEALNWGDQLLAEAGTGTGKSLAYLLPAAAWAVANQRSVVVSTHTTTLQEQLVRKDIPLVAALLPAGLVATVLKGRSHYLCRTRLAGALNRDDLDLDVVRGLVKVLAWATRTSSGDRAELTLEGAEERAWRLVNAEAEACTPERCGYARQGQDWLQRARARAEASHVVVVNHALLLSDVRVENRLLPPYRQLIVDEAHHLEAVATDQLGFAAPQARLRELMASLDGGAKGLVGRVEAAANLSDLPEAAVAQVRGLAAALRDDLRSLTPTIAVLWDCLATCVADNAAGAGEVRLTAAVRAQPAWQATELAWDAVLVHLEAVRKGLARLTQQVAAGEGLMADTGVLGADLATALREALELEVGLQRVISQPDAGDVTWLDTAGSDRVTLRLAPLHVGAALAHGLWDGKDTVILTSATLQAGATFDLLKDRLALPEASELVVESPFDYAGSTLVYLPTDMPEPNQPGYQVALSEVVAAVAQAARGRTLVLFTSYGSLNATYHQVRGPLGRAGIAVLAQGLDGERHQLMTRFRAPDQPTVLLGTRSFWEGIDVPGEALSCLVITRLPFDVPTDPVFAARSETFENPFFSYAVPQAVLRFRQGFGRLIRTATDRGVVVVLDRRIQTKGYGQQFLQALPPCQVRRAAVRDLAVVLREFVAPAPSP
jgi:predicted DnaQ family exonuclease/DinG family helicase